MAGIEPADVQMIEGCGTGVGPADDAELAALAALRSGARHVAVLGSISANIGNTGAAAGAAGLMKAVLAITNGVLPPSTGVRTPHPVLREGRAALRLPGRPEPWPAGTRHAGITSGSDGVAYHLILRGEPGEHIAESKVPQIRPLALPRAVQTKPPPGGRSLRQARPWAQVRGRRRRRSPSPPCAWPPRGRPATYAHAPGHTFAYLLRAPDRAAMIKLLSRISLIAPWLSDAQLQDLAADLARSAAGHADHFEHEIRLALTAASQEQLAELAMAARALLPDQLSAALSIRPGIYMAAGPVAPIAECAGQGQPKIALVISGQGNEPADLPQRQLSRLLAILRVLDDVGTEVSVAVGHGVGELAGLVWAGCATPAEARTLMALRSAAVTAPRDTAPGALASAIEKFGAFTFRLPQRQLISGGTGCDVSEPAAIAEMLSAELFEARGAADADSAEIVPDAIAASQRMLGAAILKAAEDATLVVQTGQDRPMARVVAELGMSPVGDGAPGSPQLAVTIDGDPADDANLARAAAALFAAGAMAKPDALYAKRPRRPIDIWRDQAFLAHPCQRPVLMPAGVARRRDFQASLSRRARIKPDVIGRTVIGRTVIGRTVIGRTVIGRTVSG